MRRTGIRERVLDSLAHRLESWADSLKAQAGGSNPTAEMPGENKASAVQVESRQAGGPPAHWLAQAHALEAGPPAHWLEQVQRHAPGLLEEEHAETVVSDAPPAPEVSQPQAALPEERPDPRPPSVVPSVVRSTDGVQPTQQRPKAPVAQKETISRVTQYAVRSTQHDQTSPAESVRRPQRRSAISHISYTEQWVPTPGGKVTPALLPRVAPARLQAGAPTERGEYRVPSTEYGVANNGRVAPAVLPERRRDVGKHSADYLAQRQPQRYEEHRNRSQLTTEIRSTQYAVTPKYAVTRHPVIETTSQQASDSYWPELPDHATRGDDHFESATRAREHICRLEEEQRER
ncbi:MAG: hypothetical protein ABI670_07485 [Chloroflexota bacterium]